MTKIYAGLSTPLPIEEPCNFCRRVPLEDVPGKTLSEKLFNQEVEIEHQINGRYNRLKRSFIGKLLFKWNWLSEWVGVILCKLPCTACFSPFLVCWDTRTEVLTIFPRNLPNVKIPNDPIIIDYEQAKKVVKELKDPSSIFAEQDLSSILLRSCIEQWVKELEEK